MKTERFHHPCPETDCEGEVHLEYDAGKSADDFYLIPAEDDVRCDLGHGPFGGSQFQTWWGLDAQELGEREQSRMEAAYEAWVDSRERKG